MHVALSAFGGLLGQPLVAELFHEYVFPSPVDLSQLSRFALQVAWAAAINVLYSRNASRPSTLLVLLPAQLLAGAVVSPPASTACLDTFPESLMLKPRSGSL